MSVLGSFSSEMIGLNHLVIYLSDGGGVGIDSGRCSDAISFGMVGVGVASGCELSNISHEEKRSGRRGLEHTGRKRRREEMQHVWR
jgi:hypothetical protein